ncbi:MAG: hypothetical protein IJJ33_04325 [Victivallales bacterium]|nr:hypothetical protein [Victivallales bacterium]
MRNGGHRWRKMVGMAFLAVLLALCVWGAMLLRGERDEAASVHYEPYTVTEGAEEARLMFRGILQATRSIPIHAATHGRITELAAQGAKVKKGDLLCSIDATSAREEIENQENNINDAELRLEQLRAQLNLVEFQEEVKVKQYRGTLAHAQLEEKQELAKPDERERRLMDIEEQLARYDLEDAQDSHDRQKKMLDKGYITPSALEPYERTLANAKATLEELLLKNRIERKGVTEERRVELRKAVERAQSNLARIEGKRERRIRNIRAQIEATEMDLQLYRHYIDHAQAQIDHASIYAPADGVFMLLNYRDWTSGGLFREIIVGDEKWNFDIIGHIIDPSDMVVKFVVNEADFQRLAVGMKVEVNLPALPGRHFPGTLRQLGAIGKDRGRVDPTAIGTGASEVQMFNASIDFQGDGTSFHPGMSALISIKVEKTRKGLFLPREALVWRDGKSGVLNEDGEWLAVTGREYNDMTFHATSGVKSGQVILIPHQRQK